MKKATIVLIAAGVGIAALLAALIIQPYYAYRISEKLGFQTLGFRAVAHGQTMRHLNELRAAQDVPVTHVFYGASTIEGLDVRRFGAGAVNHSIGGTTVKDVLKEWRAEPGALAGRDIVFLSGFNDLARGRSVEGVAADVEKMLALSGGSGRILIIGVLPVNESRRLGRGAKNETIAALNLAMRAVCAEFDNCSFADPRDGPYGFSAPLAKKYDAGDGVHLNAAGYKRLGQFIEAELAALPE